MFLTQARRTMRTPPVDDMMRRDETQHSNLTIIRIKTFPPPALLQSLTHWPPHSGLNEGNVFISIQGLSMQSFKTQINSRFIKARIWFIRPLQYQCLSIVHLNPVSMFNLIKVYMKHFNAMYFQCQWEHIFININRILSISRCGWRVYSCLPLIKP